MAMSSGNNANGTRSEINVTPLIDVLLVLLIIFMVIVPVTPIGLDAVAPQPPKGRQATVREDTIVVQVLSSRSGMPTYKINNETLPKSEVEPKLMEIFGGRQKKVMFVKGDANLNYGDVAEVVGFGHQAGVDTVGILTSRVESGS